MTNAVHLKYSCLTAFDCGKSGHAKEVIKELGITYSHSTPQTVADQWWFWNCQNVPAELPEFLTELEINLLECVGWGLSRNEAEEIERMAGK